MSANETTLLEIHSQYVAALEAVRLKDQVISAKDLQIEKLNKEVEQLYGLIRHLRFGSKSEKVTPESIYTREQ